MEEKISGITFSLLQVSLDQRISREDLERLSQFVPGLVRADCAAIARDLFGVVASGLSCDDARAFHAALARVGFASEVIADHELPALHESFQVQRVARLDTHLAFTDAMGRLRQRPHSELVFVAAGHLQRVLHKNDWESRLEFGSSGHSGMPRLVTEKTCREVPDGVFRIDFFYHTTPHRIHLLLANDTAIFHDDERMRLRDRAGLAAMSRRLAGLVPPIRWNRFLTHMDVCPEYPSLHAYEEELRWHFHRLLGTPLDPPVGRACRACTCRFDNRGQPLPWCRIADQSNRPMSPRHTAETLAASAAAGGECPQGLGATAKVLWLAKAGDWGAAHALCQDLPDPAGAWIHAWLHRQEGDYENACYWYFRAGKPGLPEHAPLDAEWFQIARELIG